MSRPPDLKSERSGTRQGATPKSQIEFPFSTDIPTEAVTDLQAEKLRRLYSFCRATACTIASLAFSVAR